MKKSLGLLIAFLPMQLLMAAPTPSAAVRDFLANARDNDRLCITLSLPEQADYTALLLRFEQEQTPNDVRAKAVLQTSMQLAALTQEPLRHRFGEQAKQVGHYLVVKSSYWLVNMLELEVNAKALHYLLQSDLTGSIERCDAFTFSLIDTKSSSDAPEVPNGREVGLSVIGASAMWQMGYTGKGRKVLIFDTGLWTVHPAVKGRFMGERGPFEHAWNSIDFSEAQDKSGSHGTHVAGTVLGLDTATRDTIGAAFGAYYLVADPIATSPQGVKPWPVLIGVFQWALNPDGDTSTVHDIPDVINNSWGKTNTGYDSLCNHPMIVQAMTGIDAAGIANVFSAGNEGPGPQTTGMPANLAYDTLSFFAVGALDGNTSSFPIAGFSSRGPTTCSTSGPAALAIKPEVSAPGVNVRSAIGRNGYSNKSGTSMAAPHVSGAVLLLKEAFPQLSGRQILNALYQTATDLGAPGEDNVFGRGLISLPAAYSFLAASHTPMAPQSRAWDLAIAGIDSPAAEFLGDPDCGVNNTASYRVKVVNLGDSIIPGFVLRVRVNQHSDSITVNQPLAPGQFMHVLTRQYSLQWFFSNQKNVLQLEAVMAMPDGDPINNRWHISFRSRLQYQMGIWDERFDSSANMREHWIIRDIDQDDNSWVFENIPATNGVQSAAVIKMRTYSPRSGQIDELISPIIQNPILLSGANVTPELEFDLAYSNRNGFSDSLFVAVQDNCQLPFVRIYSTGGDSMRTFSGVTPSDVSHWRRINLPVNWNVLFPRIKFVSKNDFGGNLYITKVNFMFNIGGSVAHDELRLRVYPNPTGDWLKMEVNQAQILKFELRDMQGRLLLQQLLPEATHHSQLHMATWPQGIYLLQVFTDKGSINTRIIKQ
ncbi:MAG: S8 family serine peptidase [Bacteroidia bacterium]